MVVDPTPYIDKSDFKAFKRVLPGLPETYAAWGYQHWTMVLADLERRGRRYQKVDVKPVEFVAFCKGERLACTQANLRHFAERKAGIV